MNTGLAFYKKCFNLENATFSLIEHDNTMVAIVYNVALPNQTLILKICTRAKDYYRELYFLTYLASKIAVPRVIQSLPPQEGVQGAILMERLPGELLATTEFTDDLAYRIGTQLALAHSNPLPGFGDITQPSTLKTDVRSYFAKRFQESYDECIGHLLKEELDAAFRYFNDACKLLEHVDGPCVIHKDFRTGNIIVNEGKLQGIIDWAAGGAGFAEEDFSTMEHGEWSVRPGSRKAFLAGYSSVRPVPDYQPLLPLLRLNKALGTIGFIVKRGKWDEAAANLYQINRELLNTLLR